MALNQVSVVGPRSEAREPVEKKKDWMDRVMEGLHIAQGITGITHDVTSIQKNWADKDAQEFAARGGLTGPQIAQADLVPAEKGALGAYVYRTKNASGDEVETPLQQAAKPKPPLSGSYQLVAGPDGKPVKKWLPSGGPDQPAYVKPSSDGGEREGKRFDAAAERAQKGLNTQLNAVSEQIASADDVIGIAKMGQENPVAAQSLGARIARAAGEKGVLTDSDAARYGGSAALSDKLNRYVTRSISGTLTDDDVKFASEFAETMREAGERRRTAITERAVNQFTAIHKGTFNDNYSLLTGYEYKAPAAKGLASPRTDPSGKAFANGAPATPVPHPQDDVALSWANKNVLSPDPKIAEKAHAILRANNKAK